jgi:hypothetical protein
MKKILDDFIDWAKFNKWQYNHKNSESLVLPLELTKRYTIIPKEYLEFLKNIEACISPDEKTWFLDINDFSNNSDSAYKWNEIEEMCVLEAEGDEEWKREIVEFWDQHIPIIFSVKNGYAYYAINVGNKFGTIVYGIEPEFEEVELIATTFKEFLDGIAKNNIKL